MTINQEKKIQNLQATIKMQEVENISQEEAMRNQYNETQELKSRIESQENKIQTQDNEIRRLEKQYQGNKTIKYENSTNNLF